MSEDPARLDAAGATRRAGPADGRIDAIVIMGVAGCGKTTVGRALAQRLGWRFADGDDFHPPANVEKMRAGIALDDDDRRPWLERLNALLREAATRGEPMVLACSALRRHYRELLADRMPGLRFVHLSGSQELIGQRLAERQHRYMPASLLASQFAALEAPRDALTLDVGPPVEELVASICERLDPKPVGTGSERPRSDQLAATYPNIAAIKFEAVSPVLSVGDLPQAIQFYREALGFELAWAWGSPPEVAAICRDQVEITLTRRADAKPASASHIYLRVSGIDGYYAEVQRLGVPIRVAIGDRDYGMRDFRIADPSGNELSIGQATTGVDEPFR
ncbi:MAG TPA: gluconokinase, GntK/IdnK-type [Burkholderiaceae bacterium]|nr:gluconokinase, GntK/IdnK-type [Burkholderiaceae bacterium]